MLQMFRIYPMAVVQLIWVPPQVINTQHFENPLEHLGVARQGTVAVGILLVGIVSAVLTLTS